MGEFIPHPGINYLQGQEEEAVHKDGCLDGSLPDRIPQFLGLEKAQQEVPVPYTPAHLTACIPCSWPEVPTLLSN